MKFPRHHRLIEKKDYQSVLDHSFKINQKHLLAFCKPNELNYARLGIIVGKRSARQAVKRNQIKRILRESFRLHQHQLAGLDVVVIGRQQSDKVSKQAFQEDIDKLWKKLLAQRSGT